MPDCRICSGTSIEDLRSWLAHWWVCGRGQRHVGLMIADLCDKHWAAVTRVIVIASDGERE